jgi:hypothetical protein
MVDLSAGGAEEVQVPRFPRYDLRQDQGGAAGEREALRCGQGGDDTGDALLEWAQHLTTMPHWPSSQVAQAVRT